MVDDKPLVDESSADALRGNRPGFDVSLGAALLAGAAAAALIGLSAHALRTAGRPFQSLDFIVNQCGALQYVVFGAALAACVFLTAKGRVIARNRRVLASAPLAGDLDPADDRALGDLRDELPKRPEFAWSILLNRVDRVVALWLSSRDVPRVAAWAKTEAARDQAASDASFGPARALQWAIPMLGFIGTMQGMMSALFQFQDDGGSAGAVQLKSAIWQATTSVGLSFWNMLTALVLTVVVMVPLTAMQRREERLLAEFDAYIDDLLIARFPSTRPAGEGPEEIAAMMEAALRRILDSRANVAGPEADHMHRMSQEVETATRRPAPHAGEVHFAASGHAPTSHGPAR